MLVILALAAVTILYSCSRPSSLQSALTNPNPSSPNWGKLASLANAERIGVSASKDYMRHSTSGWMGRALNRHGEAVEVKAWKLTDLVEQRHDASRGNMIVLVVVEWPLRDILMNWLCHVRALNIHSYVLIAADGRLRDYLLSVAHEPVVYEPSLATGGSPPMFNSPAFLEMMRIRLDLCIQVLQKGYTVVIADVDSVWLDDPLPWIWNSMRALRNGEMVPHQTQRCGVKGSNEPCHVIALSDFENKAQICFGLIAFRSTKTVLRILQNVSWAMKNQSMFEFKGKLYNDQELLSQYIGGPNGTNLPWNVLNTQRFPPGRSFFLYAAKDYLAGSRLPPIVVHNNWILGHDKKEARFRNFGLWRVRDAENGLCRDTGLPSKPVKLDPSIKIVMLCNDDFRGFVKAMDSLSYTAGVPTSHKIDLEVVLRPSMSRQQIKVFTRAIKKMKWKFGKFSCRLGINGAYDLADHWASIWDASDDYGAVLVADEMLRVTPWWYAWSITAMTAKCDDVDLGMDGRVATVVPSLTSSIPSQYAKPVRMQERSTWNRVFLKHQWKQFYEWLKSKPLGYVPGFPFATYARIGQFNGSIWDRSWCYYHSTFMGEKGLWTIGSKPDYPPLHVSGGAVEEVEELAFSSGSGRFGVEESRNIVMWNEIEQNFKNCHVAPKTDYWGATVESAGALGHRLYMVWGEFPLERDSNEAYKFRNKLLRSNESGTI
ncbi:hypothetical protein SeLEV6574_g03491 [Synchytrium endobioticum]|uniref:Nucleotide-diphospho-sugar transferase domain-containing protein n=1 Tax=Synchytrium endobioticum TaxID=286115 RepID=A0A507D3F2_9FUNG|nr:hypothetical protein SeLEV6574_g03491 [Synchytrium endobioticum]